MPTYDYRCDGCDHAFEEFQSITDAPLKKCPKCGKAKLRRLIGTGAAILFKGSGFYQTDYRSESYKNAAKADEAKMSSNADKTDANSKAASDGTTGSDSVKSERKPAKTKA
ncbi:MAG: zinc ribbon domain-containing protein [Gemmataceae bacterium]|nr:zinc ribbon domain-containing protein [Gemmataceae bacterium]